MLRFLPPFNLSIMKYNRPLRDAFVSPRQIVLLVDWPSLENGEAELILTVLIQELCLIAAALADLVCH